jgi:type I restriction enzyme M protein
MWLRITPEESVRQAYLCILVNEYGFSLDQIEEEVSVTGRGSASARADFLIWRSSLDRNDKKSPLIVVECKSDNAPIRSIDYAQGSRYARLSGAEFVITHNSHETKYCACFTIGCREAQMTTWKKSKMFLMLIRQMKT